MKHSLFILATLLLFVACGKKVEVKETAKDLPIPEFKLLSTEEPRFMSNGRISAGENLVYNIEIDHPMPKDSLELLQDYFIEKGVSDFEGINKVIVRAYLKGTFINRTPYASMNLVSGNKDILINEGVVAIQESNETTSTEPEQVNADSFVGKYHCNRTHDTYVFKSDNTGYFTIQGSTCPSVFTWERKGNVVIILYDGVDEVRLEYVPQTFTIIEDDELLGRLVFSKQ